MRPEGKSGADNRDGQVETQAQPHVIALQRLRLVQAGGLDPHEDGAD